MQQSLPQNPDPARKETVEPPNLANPRLHPPDLHKRSPEDQIMIPDLVAFVN
jgi:hypothetical protein